MYRNLKKKIHVQVRIPRKCYCAPRVSVHPQLKSFLSCQIIHFDKVFMNESSVIKTVNQVIQCVIKDHKENDDVQEEAQFSSPSRRPDFHSFGFRNFLERS